MQINNNSLNLSTAVAAQTSVIDQNKAGTRAGGGASGGGDIVQISSLASQLGADPSRLAELQAAYQAGTYSVSPSQIANSMIKDAFGS